MVELRKCPVCGSKAVLEVYRNKIRIRCSEFDADTHPIEVKAQTQEAAIMLWDEGIKGCSCDIKGI